MAQKFRLAALNWLAALAMASLLNMSPPALAAKPAKDAANSRSFRFTYAATLEHLPVGETVHVWLPVPSTSRDQDITIESDDAPAGRQITREPHFGNQMLYFTSIVPKEQTISTKMVFRVTRRESEGDPGSADERDDTFLLADSKVPVGGKALKLLAGVKLSTDPTDRARQIYDVVDDHMVYRKDKPGWGLGDSEWACDSGFGNCTDFHSLFISLARASKIPARFQIGFLLPEKRGAGLVAGYHCWAFFHPDGKAWIPVDISEASQHPALRDYYFGHLSPDRVAFTAGRDLVLVPRQQGPPLNFFIYPYAEIAGKPVPADQIKHEFSYQDLRQTNAAS